MAKGYLSNRQKNLKVGIGSYTENSTVLEVTGKVGIGTTNATSNLHIIGDARVSGVVTASSFVGSGASLTGLTGASAATYGSSSQSPQIVVDANGRITSITNVSIAAGGGAAGEGIVIQDESGIGVTAISTLNFVGDNITAVASTITGIATITIASNLVGTALSISGISTLGVTSATNLTVQQLNVSGISTFAGVTTHTSSLFGTQASFTGVVTASSFSGNASSATYATSAGIATYATTSGVSTNVIGGISSVTQLNVSGISTLQSTTIVGGGTSTGTSGQILQVAGISSGAYIGGNLGIGNTLPTSKLDVVGDAKVSGVVTATTFIGALTGTATTATKLATARTFEITGDVVASAISFDGSGNVSLAATIQPNSVGLGTDTTGDYVRDITGTSNQITVTSGTGEGSTPTLSIPNQFTAPQDVTITRDLQVNRNLNVTGNITIGGTSATLFTTEFKVYDPDIVLGFRTDGSGNDISTDNTANHGGIAIASTEGTPLVNLFIAGIETNPSTYKKIMWFKSGTFSGLGTDAWLSNYAIGIGSTQVPNGVRLAAGAVQFTQNDLSVVRNINASGVVTATTFVGALTGTATSTTNIPNLTGDVTSNNTTTTLATVNSNVGTYGDAGAIPSITVNAKGLVTGVTTVAPNNGQLSLAVSGTGLSGSATFTANQSGSSTFTVTSNATDANTTSTIVARDASGNFSAGTITANLTGTATTATNLANAANITTGTINSARLSGTYSIDISGNAATSGYATTAGVSTSVIGGIASVTQLNVSGISTLGVTSATNLTTQQLNVSGLSTFAGITTYTASLFGTQASFTGVVTASSFSGNASSATYATSSGVSTSVIGGIASVTQLSVSGVSTVGLLTATSIGIGTTNPTSSLWVNGDGYFVGVLTANRIISSVYGEFTGGGISGTNIVGTSLSISGISTLGVTSTTNLTTQQLNVSGLSTFSGITTYTASLFGTQASFTGVVTASSFSGNASSATYATSSGIASALTASASVNTTGIITASQFSTGSGTIGFTTNTITGPTELTIDPAAVGDNTGAVRIKGDLYVDGTQTFINSTTIELADFNVGIATTVGTNLLLDGAGIGIGSTGIRKTITWNNTASALTSSEDWNLVSGKQYEINGTSVLNSTTLGSGVTNSSLTSVGTLGSLNVSGITTLAGNIFLGDNTADDITVSGEFISNLIPNATNSYDLGSSTQRWKDVWVSGNVTAGSGVLISGIGIATAGGTVGSGVTTIDFRGSAISTVTVTSGIATVNIVDTTGGGGGGGTGTTFFGAKFDTNIDNTLYIQPTGTLDIVGVGTTTTQITTFPAGSTEYIIHSIHVTNISNGDAEITGGFLLNSRAVPASISVSVGQSGSAGVNTVTVGSASSIVLGMSVFGTGNIGETTGVGASAGFQFNTYVTNVSGNVISLSKPMSGYAVGVATFVPTSRFASRLPVPVGSAVELLKQPFILGGLDSIVLQSTGAGTGVGSTSTAAISQTANSNILTVTAGAAITNFVTAGQLITPTGSNTGIQTNTFVGVGYTPGSLSIPMTRPATSTLSSQILSFTEVVTPQDGALQATIVYQTTTDTSFQNGVGIASTTPTVYYGTGNTYPAVIQSIRVTNISDGFIYPGGDYPVWVGIGNSDTIFSWLAYNMIIPKNSSIELCEAPKRLGIGQSIFAYALAPNTIEIQIAARQKLN